MAFHVKFKEKKKVDGLDTVCCWCYEISADGDDSFDAFDEWGLDLSDKVVIQDPAHYSECNNYEVGDSHNFITQREKKVIARKLTAAEKAAKKFTLCFISTCAENQTTEFSLENYNPLPPRWQDHKIEGGNSFVGPAIAAAPASGSNDIIATLAKYEGLKLAQLLSVTAGGTPAVIHVERPDAPDGTEKPR